MKVDIFGGAHRITLVICAIVAICGTVMAFNDSPWISLTYRIAPPPGPMLTRVQDCLPFENQYTDRKYTEAGHRAHITFCSTLPRNDIKAIFETSTLDTKEQKEIGVLWWKGKVEIVTIGLGFTLLAIFGVLVTSRVIGWIVRGFIPSPEQ